MAHSPERSESGDVETLRRQVVKLGRRCERIMATGYSAAGNPRVKSMLAHGQAIADYDEALCELAVVAGVPCRPMRYHDVEVRHSIELALADVGIVVREP